MSNIAFTQASRASTVPLIAVYGKSGSGKTFSALLLARGIAGPEGLICVSDSETGRASIYSDTIPGGFVAALIEPPYHPRNYIAHIDAMEKAGAAVGIIDSGSHEWEGIGGILDMAGDNENKSGRAGLHNWKQPKQEHNLFIQRLLRCKIPLIICLRAKEKTRQVKGTAEMAEANTIQRNQVGKTCIIKDDFCTPIQAEDFVFEATVHIEVMPDHTCNVTKGGTPDLRRCLPKNFEQPLSVEHGKAIADWMRGGGPKMTGAQPAKTSPTQAPADTQPGPLDEIKKLKAELWSLVKSRFADAKEFQQHLWDEGMLLDTEELATLPANRLSQIVNAIQVQPQ